MCEPLHSIIQYPDKDPDSGNPTDERVERGLVGKGVDWFKKIWDWFHCSRLGSGHSEAMAQTPIGQLLLPAPTFYEGFWWDRTVKIDGWRPKYEGRDYDADLALKAATEYSSRVVMGDLGKLRRFLDQSMRKSERPHMYVQQFLDKVILPQKRDQVYTRLTYVDPLLRTRVGLWNMSKDNLDKVIKVILGYTRKRDFLCSAWADDSSLWVPGTT